MRHSTLLFLIAFTVCAKPDQVHADADLAAAERFIDAFYAFDGAQLKAALSQAPDSAPQILYYQGWAEGGNYTVLKRFPCVRDTNAEIACSITVEDDLIKALGLDFNVTDTFHLTVANSAVLKATTSSDDPPEFHAAQAWVQKERAELIKEPCIGYFAGGPTPQRCVQAVVSGFREFTQLAK